MAATGSLFDLLDDGADDVNVQELAAKVPVVKAAAEPVKEAPAAAKKAPGAGARCSFAAALRKQRAM